MTACSCILAVGVQQSDACRLAQLRSHTARAGHLYRQFTWGNRKSLVEQPADAGIDVRHRLMSYYKCALMLLGVARIRHMLQTANISRN